MLHLRYSARFWILNALISESTRVLNILRVLNVSKLHKILNKVFPDRCLEVFWICFRFWICHDSKYTRLHKVENKIFHQGSEYVSSSEYTSVTQGSVENSTSYMFDRFLSVPWALNMLGLEYARVVNMPRFCVNCILKILSILNVMSSEYAKVLNVSGV